jgi:hypothetical protein
MQLQISGYQTITRFAVKKAGTRVAARCTSLNTATPQPSGRSASPETKACRLPGRTRFEAPFAFWRTSHPAPMFLAGGWSEFSIKNGDVLHTIDVQEAQQARAALQ